MSDISRSLRRIAERANCADMLIISAAADQLDNPTRTLRDEFAMAALTALAAKDGDAIGPYWTHEDKAIAAYRYADAMLEARKVKP